jgi:N-acyl amino acid synthase of PEP-CTERM/exosortase system
MTKPNAVYEILLADTDESKKIHFKLRYQVYCLEKQYENPENFQDGMEWDEHDSHAAHFLIRHRTSMEWAGTFRLIPGKLHKLPSHQHIKASTFNNPKQAHHFAEFSRLIITRPFQNLPSKSKNMNDRDIVFKAICTGIEYARQQGANIIIFLGRRALAKTIHGMGIRTSQVSGKTLHKGVRYAYKFDLTNFPHSLFETTKSLQAYQRSNSFKAYSQANSFIESNIDKIVEKHFRLVEANTPALIQQAHYLRQHAYSPKPASKAPSATLDIPNLDRYDNRSEYCLVMHRESGAYAATTQLILPDCDDLQQPFPIEQYCRIERNDILSAIPRTQLAEVSRFCVSADFKRREGEQDTVSGVCKNSAATSHVVENDQRRHFPHITLALLASVLRVTSYHGITHCYALMEPALILLLQHMGIHATPVGPATHYHGQCVPCIIEVKSLLADSGRFSQVCRQAYASV